MTSTDVIQEVEVAVAAAIADYHTRHAGTAREVAAETISCYGPYGYEVQRNNLCAYVANASRNMIENYAAALDWSMAHPEVAVYELAALRRYLDDLTDTITLLERQHKAEIFALERRIATLEEKK